MGKSIRQMREIEDARANAEAAVATAAADEAAKRLTAGEATTAELAAAELVRRMQGAGAPYEASLFALEVMQGLTPASRQAVADQAYRVGVPVELPPYDPADPDTWPEARRRPDSGALVPEVDVDDLFGDCPVYAARVREVAAEALVTPDMPAMAALAFASFACAARVRGVVTNRDGSFWRMFPNLFVAVEAVSGGKKSYVRRRMGGSLLLDYAAELRLRFRDLQEEDEHERSVVNGRVGALRAAEIKGKPPDREALASYRARLAVPRVCVPEYILSVPGSAERYVQRLRSSGYCALVPDEGKEAIKKFVSGMDGAGENCGPLLSAHTVETFIFDSFAGAERGDDALPFRVLCGGAFLPLQPSVLTPATPHEAQLLAAISSRGLLARMLVARPRLLDVVERQALRARVDSGELGAANEAAYADVLGRLLRDDVNLDHPLAPAAPVSLYFAPDANAAFLAFQADAEDSAAPGGEFYHSPGSEFVRRQADHVARLAVVLAVLRMGEVYDGGIVELRDVERACRAMTKYFRPHALAVAQRTVHDPIGDDAEKCWQIVAEAGTLRKRELQQKLGAGWGKSKAGDRQSRIDAALEELAERGRIDVTMGERNARTIRVIRRCM